MLGSGYSSEEFVFYDVYKLLQNVVYYTLTNKLKVLCAHLVEVVNEPLATDTMLVHENIE